MTRPPGDVATRNFTFVLGSARSGGNTEALARHAAGGLRPDTGRTWLRLHDLPLPEFTEPRPGDGRPAPRGNEKLLLDATLGSTDLVVASPLYWYSVSAATKLYLDYWALWMGLPDVGFRERMRGKTLWAVTAYARGEARDTDPLTGMLRQTADYLGMRWGGALLTRAGRPADLEGDPAVLRRAARFFGDPG
ncbi:flavodoxin family protein [Streptomyces subrutilus]|uniref:flavodoxin family protein n=1 Tax=Streptomyces subrutilus TaxID=36818 RepID=UPI0033D631D9